MLSLQTISCSELIRFRHDSLQLRSLFIITRANRYVQWRHERISVKIVFVNYVKKVLYSVATRNVLIGTVADVSKVAATPVVATRRVPVIPCVVHAVYERVLCVVDEVVMVCCVV